MFAIRSSLEVRRLPPPIGAQSIGRYPASIAASNVPSDLGFRCRGENSIWFVTIGLPSFELSKLMRDTERLDTPMWPYIPSATNSSSAIAVSPGSIKWSGRCYNIRSTYSMSRFVKDLAADLRISSALTSKCLSRFSGRIGEILLMPNLVMISKFWRPTLAMALPKNSYVEYGCGSP